MRRQFYQLNYHRHYFDIFQHVPIKNTFRQTLSSIASKKNVLAS